MNALLFISDITTPSAKPTFNPFDIVLPAILVVVISALVFAIAYFASAGILGAIRRARLADGIDDGSSAEGDNKAKDKRQALTIAVIFTAVSLIVGALVAFSNHQNKFGANITSEHISYELDVIDDEALVIITANKDIKNMSAFICCYSSEYPPVEFKEILRSKDFYEGEQYVAVIDISDSDYSIDSVRIEITEGSVRNKDKSN